MADPFLDAVNRIAMGHYGGAPPARWLSRISPQLQASPAGRRLLASLSGGRGTMGLGQTTRVKRTPFGTGY